MGAILIVDDELAIAEVLASILDDAGYKVVIAANGKQALSRLAETRPSLIITDFMMPVVGGAELIAALKGDRQLRDIPVVVMTSVPEGKVKEKIKGFDGYLRKPFQLREVLGIVLKLAGPSVATC
jgi:CheY-like chemotaxis protein